MENEIWKDIKGWEGLYQISNFGRVRSLDRTIPDQLNGGMKTRKSRIMKQSTAGRYNTINLFDKNAVATTRTVHRLVAIHFIDNPDNLPEVNHEDGNKKNNNDWNLKWTDRKGNAVHAYENGLIKHYQRQILKITEDGNTICEYESIKDAAIKHNINKSCIHAAIKKGMRSAGFFWKYKTEKN